MKTYIARPYRRNLGLPSFEFDFNAGTVTLRTRGKRTTIATWDPDDSRPGLSDTTPARCAAAIVGFFMAYVERPAEFDRDPEATEQVHRAAWIRHGETLACFLPE